MTHRKNPMRPEQAERATQAEQPSAQTERGGQPAQPPKSAMPADTGCAASEPFALRVIGDSMEPEFKDGCIIIIDPSAPVEHGAFVIAETDSGPIFRQFIVDDERMFLKPLNAGYPTEPLKDKSAVTGVIVQRSGARRSEHKHYP